MFKQHYTYFYTLFHPHIFSKNTNNITRTTLPNRLQISQLAWTTTTALVIFFLMSKRTRFTVEFNFELIMFVRFHFYSCHLFFFFFLGWKTRYYTLLTQCQMQFFFFFFFWEGHLHEADMLLLFKYKCGNFLFFFLVSLLWKQEQQKIGQNGFLIKLQHDVPFIIGPFNGFCWEPTHTLDKRVQRGSHMETGHAPKILQNQSILYIYTCIYKNCREEYGPNQI